MADYYGRLEFEYLDDPERQEEELERDRWRAAYVLSKKQRGAFWRLDVATARS
jgi:hypothetical protein